MNDQFAIDHDGFHIDVDRRHDDEAGRAIFIILGDDVDTDPVTDLKHHRLRPRLRLRDCGRDDLDILLVASAVLPMA
jgi:hypothetical protein